MISSWAVRAAGAVLLAAVVSVPTPAVAEPSDPARPSCRTVERTVSLGALSRSSATISGTLCLPARWGPGRRQIDILVHGGSYNAGYWDWPQDGSKYSYVKRAVADGRATFAYNRLGTGGNSRPPSTSVTISSDAYVLHQVVTWLRADYQGINVVSHSIGGLISIEEAARYNDIDRLVVTGMLHGVGVGIGGAAMLPSFYPAALDPRFSGQGSDLGWVTTLPGLRGPSFYNTKTADPDVIAYDEAHKDVTTELTLVDSAVSNKLTPGLNSTSRVRVPVLSVVGEQDALFCGILLDCRNKRAVHLNEAPFFGKARSFTVETIPDTGHNLTLHPSSARSYDVISDWISKH